MTDSRINKKLVSIFASGKINLAAFERLSGVKAAKVKDVIREKSTFTEDEVIAIRKALNGIRIEAKKHVENWSKKKGFSDRELVGFKKFLAETPELVIMHVFELKKLIDFRNGKQVALSTADIQQAVNRLSIFILETSV